MEKFFKWLDANTPKAGGCLLVMDDSDTKRTRYYLIERWNDGEGKTMFNVNAHFFWDFTDMFNDSWKIIYKREI